jgi:hypothetical protein
MRWDGIGASIRGSGLVEVAEVIEGALRASLEHGRSRRRYGQVIDCNVDGRLAAWVGFDQANESVYVEGKGETSPALVECLRQAFPDHTAPRLDVCEDYDQAGAFELLQGLVRAHKGDRVKGGYVALPDNPDEGRTWAAGVRGGAAYVRVYEAGKMRERAHVGRPDWVRAELECRPHYAKDKAAAARMSPLEVWGMAGWTRRVGEALAQVPVPRYVADPRAYAEDKTTAYLARTYRRHWQEMLADLGDWECVGRELARIWQEDDELQARLNVARH